MQKKCLLPVLLALLMLLSGCRSQAQPAQIAATTLPVYEFTSRLCEGTPLTVTRLVTESVSCLHDYSLNVRQVKAAEAAEAVVISGAGLEDFLDSIENQCLYQILIKVDRFTLQIALMKIQGYSTREIAVYLDITEKAVYRRMDRLKEKLKKFFE